MIAQYEHESCEIQSVDEIIAKSLPALWRTLRSAAVDSVFWQARFTMWGVNPADLSNLNAFQSIPLLDKKALLTDQLESGLYGTLLAVPQEQLRRVHRTTGSTDVPLLVLLTANDVANVVQVGKRAFRCAGVAADQVVIHCLNYCMWSGGVTDHQCLEAAGATVIPFGVGNSTLLLQTILRIKPSALSCTPSYLARLRRLLEDEFGLAPSDLKLETIYCGGEAGLQDAAFRKSLEDVWCARAVDANYGLSEVLSIIASECTARSGLHFHAQGVLFPELVDENGRSLVIARGARGELVLTNLVREAQPLIRYRTSDLIEIVDTHPCICGRGGFRFNVVGRCDDMVKVKGVNFSPSSLQGYMNAHPQLTGEYRVYARKPPVQELRVEIELVRDQAGLDRNVLAEQIERDISVHHGIKVQVIWMEYGSMPKSDNKTTRLIRE